MKIKQLQILNSGVYVGGTQGRPATDQTHDIAYLDGEGFILRDKRTGRAYFVHASLAVAEIEPGVDEEAEEDESARKPVRRAPGRGGRKAPEPDGDAVSG